MGAPLPDAPIATRAITAFELVEGAVYSSNQRFDTHER